MAFVSETYLNRPYCREELEAFLHESDERKRQRLFLIVLDQWAEQQRGDWPGGLPRDFLYELLFDEKGPLPIRLRSDAEAVDNPQITQIIEKLARGTVDRARELKLISNPGPPFEPVPGQKWPRVAVGAVTDLRQWAGEIGRFWPPID